MQPIHKKYISSINFKTLDAVEYPPRQKVSYTMTPSDITSRPLDNNVRLNQLRKKLDYIFHNTLKSSYQLLYENCDITDTTFRKFIKGSRRLSKTNLVKFILGTKLDQDTAEELLSMNETPFDYENLFDYITACAIRDSDTIDMLHEELVRYGCKGLFENGHESE